MFGDDYAIVFCVFQMRIELAAIYSNIQMAPHDTNVHRYLTFGIVSFTVIVDSFSTIKYD
ncbi:hypothetical protein H8356DRAFT_1417664 [Neocallimastix lanati (nom. inval.)]|nr:hypothetical protein H8356DRAFT_1417664 [Neocallimastix sp. JGI-2020a]